MSALLVPNPNDADVLLVIDAHNLAWKAYYSPVVNEHLDSRGFPTYHYYIALNKIGLCCEYISSNYPNFKVCLVYSFDEYVQKKRKLFPEYKSNRNNKLKEYKVATRDGIVTKELNPMGISKVLNFIPHCEISIPSHDEETDDVIATFVHKYETDKIIFILSSDKDLWQLKSKRTHIIIKESPITLLNRDIIKSKFYNSDRRNIAFIKAIVGDSSDGLKAGIPFFPRKMLSEVNYGEYMGNITKGIAYLQTLGLSKNCKNKIESEAKRIANLFSIIKLKKNLNIKENYVDGSISLFKKFLTKRKMEKPRILKLWIQGI